MIYRILIPRQASRIAIALSLFSLFGCSLFGTPPDKKLLGQWQGAGQNGQQQTLIFNSEGKLFILPEGVKPPVALEMKYKLNPGTKPMQIDLIVNDQTKVQTIFEFPGDKELRLQLEGLSPQTPRPGEFSAQASVLKKTAETTTLPADVKVESLESQLKKAQSAEGIQYTSGLMKAQESYQSKNGKFAKDVKELGLGGNPETANYKYEIVPQSDSSKSVAILAQAKNPELFSYTGVIFILKDSGKNVPVGQICITEKPSTSSPSVPKAPADKSTPIQCPAGSKPIN